jgi:hypothetical protein
MHRPTVCKSKHRGILRNCDEGAAAFLRQQKVVYTGCPLTPGCILVADTEVGREFMLGMLSYIHLPALLELTLVNALGSEWGLTPEIQTFIGHLPSTLTKLRLSTKPNGQLGNCLFDLFPFPSPVEELSISSLGDSLILGEAIGWIARNSVRFQRLKRIQLDDSLEDHRSHSYEHDWLAPEFPILNSRLGRHLREVVLFRSDRASEFEICLLRRRIEWPEDVKDRLRKLVTTGLSHKSVDFLSIHLFRGWRGQSQPEERAKRALSCRAFLCLSLFPQFNLEN